MTQWLRQSTAVTVKLGPFLDKTDGVTLESGISSSDMNTNLKLSKAFGAFAARNGTPGATSYDTQGYYAVPLNTTDTGTLGTLEISVSDPATHLHVWDKYTVLSAVVYDALVAGTDNLQVDLTQILGGTITETTPGNIRAAWQKMWDVDAPTATAEGLSGDSSWITTIASIYSLLQTVAASVATLLSRMLTGIYATSRVDPISGNINQIVVGDSYNNAKGTAFEWTSDSWADYDIDSVNATITFYCRAKEGGDILFTATCTAPAANRLRLELDDTDTRKLSPVVNRALVFQIKVAWSDAVTSSPLTLVDGIILRVIPNRST